MANCLDNLVFFEGHHRAGLRSTYVGMSYLGDFYTKLYNDK